MSLVGLVILLFVAGFLLTLVPIDETVRKVATAVIVLIAVVVILRWAAVL